MKLKNSRRTGYLFIWHALFILHGCGYQFAEQSALLPKDIHTVYVEPFIDRTRDVGLGQEVTSAVRSEFYRAGQLRVVDRMDEADAIVGGVIRSLQSHVLSVNRRDSVLQYETILAAEVTLRRRAPSEILWRQGLNFSEVYSGSRAAVVTTSPEFRRGTLNTADVRRMTDIQLTESEARQARTQLINSFARELRQRLMEMF